MLFANVYLRVLANVAVIGTLFGTLLSVTRLIQLRGEGLTAWPSERTRVAPWGWVGMLLVVLTYLIVSLLVQGSYLVLRGSSGWRIGPAVIRPDRPDAVADASRPADDTQSKSRQSPHSDPPLFSSSEKMFLTSALNAATLLVIPWVLRRSSGCRWEDLGLTRKGLKSGVAAGFLAFFLVVPCVYAVFALAQLVFRVNPHELEEMVRKETGPQSVILAVLSAVVFAPAAEELLFRGVLQSWLSRVFRGPTPDSEVSTNAPGLELIGAQPLTSSADETDEHQARARRADRQALVVTSLLFGLIHAPQMPAPFAIFVLSLALGALYQRTGNLAACFTLHALFNGLSTIVLLGSVGR